MIGCQISYYTLIVRVGLVREAFNINFRINSCVLICSIETSLPSRLNISPTLHKIKCCILCFHKQTKQTLEVVSFILREQDILVKEVLSFIMKKQDNFLKEVVSFLKKLLVSRKQKCPLHILYYIYPTSHNISYVIFIELKIEQIFK